jgi:hypothetical protein
MKAKIKGIEVEGTKEEVGRTHSNVWATTKP